MRPPRRTGPCIAQIDFKNGKRHQVLANERNVRNGPSNVAGSNRRGAIENSERNIAARMNKDALTTSIGAAPTGDDLEVRAKA